MMERSYPLMSCEGRIRVFKRSPGSPDELLVERHNVVVYRAADILAKILSGDVSYAPSRIGYIYAGASKSFTNPAADRLHEWGSISSAIAANAGNMTLCPLAAPTFSVIGDTNLYANNTVTFSAMSDKSATRAFSGGAYDNTPPASGKKYFQVALLSRVYQSGNSAPTYIPYALAQCTDTDDGLAVEDNTELVIYWSMSFK
jgi:hypothetical protein